MKCSHWLATVPEPNPNTRPELNLEPALQLQLEKFAVVLSLRLKVHERPCKDAKPLTAEGRKAVEPNSGSWVYFGTTLEAESLEPFNAP